MRKSYRESALFKAIAGVTVAGIIGLTVSTSAFAFDSDYDGNSFDGQVIGLSLNGNFDFNNISVMGFAQRSVNNTSGTIGDSNSFFSIKDNVATTQLPLLTFGDSVKYPGMLYNQNGTQFYDYIASAAEGDAESQSMVWNYVVGGVFLGGIVIAVAVNDDDDDDDDDDATPAAVNTGTNNGTGF